MDLKGIKIIATEYYNKSDLLSKVKEDEVISQYKKEISDLSYSIRFKPTYNWLYAKRLIKEELNEIIRGLNLTCVIKSPEFKEKLNECNYIYLNQLIGFICNIYWMEFTEPKRIEKCIDEIIANYKKKNLKENKTKYITGIIEFLNYFSIRFSKFECNRIDYGRMKDNEISASRIIQLKVITQAIEKCSNILAKL